MMIIEGLRVISPFPSGLGVARPRSESRLLCFLGVSCELPCICVSWLPEPEGLGQPSTKVVSSWMPRSCWSSAMPLSLCWSWPAERAGGVTLGAPAFPQYFRDW